ncbi:MAG: MerR family transcriptional regulator [Anaerolineae bacterium]
MFKIGAFSQLTGVTVKALRHYDRVGLLKPAEVDRFTGYRYYTVAQINQLNRILALKDLGLSLEEVRHVLHENPSAGEIRGMLRLKQMQLQRTIDEEQARLQRVEARLRQIEREGQMPTHEIVVREVMPQRVLAYREILAGPWEIRPLFMRVGQTLAQKQVDPIGPQLALYYQGEYREYDLDVEIAVPTAGDAPETLPLDDEATMTCQILPGVQVASTLCRMETQADIYAANRDLGNWIVENGYRLAEGPCREVYAEPACEGEPLIFEVQLPIER